MKALSLLLLLLFCAACQQNPKSEPLFFGHTREYWRDLNEKFKAEDEAKRQKEWADSAPQRQAQAEREAKEEREWRKQQAEAAKYFQRAEDYAQQLSAWRESQRQQQLKDAAELQAWRMAQLNQQSASRPTQASTTGTAQGIIAAGGRAQLFTPRDETQDKLDAIKRQIDMQAEQAKLDAFRQHQIENAKAFRATVKRLQR